ncbi:PREDICTED: MFS-type transporter SLC18B1-like, partial [Priapulus caudatus]|uniref:MFS-type transporter SLC18B1-like n=1 Tax=Priapulus caudatus TaxID=37621 RepID=A0ABM1EVY3_PRICU
MGVEDLEDGVVGTPPSGNSHTHSGEHTRPRTRSKGPSHDLVVASFEASLKNTTMSMHRLTSLERYHHSNLSIDASGSLHVVAPGDEADGQKAAGGFFDLPARQKLCILAIAVADFFSGTSYSLIAPFFPEEGLQKGATSTQVGLIIGCFQLVGFIISPILGKH